MNDLESYQYLAQQNARRCRPKRLEEIDTTIPYFEIYKDPLGKYDIKGYNYETHDNAPRMILWHQYLNKAIFPFIKSKDIDIKGFYNIQLHDSYTYLEDGKSYDDVLVFSKFKKDVAPVLIPDPYAMQNWGGVLDTIRDNTPWSNKINKVCFYGTTTGNRSPALNQRLSLCLWSLAKPNLYDFKITQIAQMSQADVHSYLGDKAQQVISSPMPPSEQTKYKYHLVLDGNTCRFDVWNYLTNSVTLKYHSKEMLWYYPLMHDGVHFIEVNKDNMEDKMRGVDNNTAILLAENAKRLIRKVANPMTHVYYTKALFETMAENGA